AALGDKDSQIQFLSELEKYAYVTADTGKPDDHRTLYDIVDPLEDIPPEVIGKLVTNLEHPTARVRKFTAFTLGRTQASESAPGLIKLLENQSDTVRARRYAAAALGIIG